MWVFLGSVASQALNATPSSGPNRSSQKSASSWFSAAVALIQFVNKPTSTWASCPARVGQVGGGHFDTQAGLADAARPDECDQAAAPIPPAASQARPGHGFAL
jgi:hypothetical protein